MPLYKTPRRGTKTERIVKLLREMPYCGYQKIGRLTRTTRQVVAVTARQYGLQRGSNRIASEDREAMIRMIQETSLPYSDISRMCGHYGRHVACVLAHKERIHDSTKRNKITACRIARDVAAQTGQKP